MGIMDLFKKKSSGNVAKDRLKLVLVSDRANCSSEMMEMMKRDIIEVISRYMDIDAEALDVKITETESDSNNGMVPALVANIPQVETAEIQQPSPERRIMSITLKPGETQSTLILVFQDEQISTLCIDDLQIEALIIGIQQALKTVGDQELVQYLSSNMDFLMCYTVDLTTQPNIDYQQYPQEDWKLNLFSHYLGVLYCCETDEGKKIVSGAVVKTSAPHLSELENNVVTRIIEKSPKLKAMHAELAPCQIFSTIIPSQPGRMLSLEECLRPLHAFYLEKKAELSA